MSKPWFRNFFPQAAPLNPETVQMRADGGDANAQFSLGLGCATNCSTQNYATAAQWYLKAAGQNHALAQFNLGIMHANGHGMPQDNVEALIWFTKAAQQGDAGAQHQLGMENHRASLHQPADGAKESRIEAYKWYRLAAAQDYRGSMGASEQLALRMAREDIADGDSRAAAFQGSK